MTSQYRFLPFFFERLDGHVLLTNDSGKFYFLDQKNFQRFINKELATNTELYFDLISNHFIYENNAIEIIKFLSTTVRTKKKHLYDFTSLHMLIVTQRCNQKCLYCHAASESQDAADIYDMDMATACKCVDIALLSPSKYIKFEFQGGEPLLNFDVIKHTVKYALSLASSYDKNLQFVICTNLTLLNQDHIDFIREYDVYLSTSLDGPKILHDQCRKFRDGSGTYDILTKKLETIQEIFGQNKISALLTITKSNLNHLQQVIDAYINAGLPSIFLRMMNPYGFAIDEWQTLAYSVNDFIAAYKNALEYIIKINQQGVYFPEEFASVLLKRILTPFPTGFVDLQSPSGAGISAVAYETNGDVYVADEGRMLAKRSKDRTFCIGNVVTETFNQIFCSEKLMNMVQQSTIEAIPGCGWCAYQPFCGSDPVKNYIQYRSFGLKNAHTDFCRKHKAIFNILFEYLNKSDDSVLDVFWSWVKN
jgi:uncharacterized protein